MGSNQIELKDMHLNYDFYVIVVKNNVVQKIDFIKQINDKRKLVNLYKILYW